jgi:hypothetical protein
MNTDDEEVFEDEGEYDVIEEEDIVNKELLKKKK